MPIPCFYHKDTEESLLTADIVKHVKEGSASKLSDTLSPAFRIVYLLMPSTSF